MNKTLVASAITIIGIALVAALVYFYPNLIFGAGKRVVVPDMEPTQITINDVAYTFIKDQNGFLVHTGVGPLSYNSKHFSFPKQGETYPWLGISLKILEVHADRYVIRVTSRD